MRGVQYLGDGHHVDDEGTLISCTYVDFRDPGDRSLITTLWKASPRQYAIPGCGTIRISKPSCFRDHGEGLVLRGEEGDDDSGPVGASVNSKAALADAPEASTDAVRFGTNGWIYCASIQPETLAERSAWREVMLPGHDAVSPIRRPRAFARALGALVAEQVGPRGRTVLLRNTVEGEAFSTAHRSQTVYHGPVVYSDEVYRRLERASSDLELLLLLVFLRDAAHRAQREYRFVAWAEDEPGENRLDLSVSPSLVEAMQVPPRGPDGGGYVPAGVEESSTVEATQDDNRPRGTLHVETLPAFVAGGNPTVAPRRYDVESLPGDVREMAFFYAAIQALRSAVAKANVGCRKDAAAAAWHAEPVLHFFCSTFGDGIARVRVDDNGFNVITAELSGDGPVEATIAVGPEGTFACRITMGSRHLASTAPDAPTFESVLKRRLAEVGVRGTHEADPD